MENMNKSFSLELRRAILS